MNVLLNKRFLPVIHCISPQKQKGIEHAITNAQIAFENFADGIFLIGHNLVNFSLCCIYEQVRKQFPNRFIGINFLDVASNSNWKKLERIINSCSNINALWIDSVPDAKLIIDPKIEVFGGVAFKYLNPDQSGDELISACNHAKQIVDVITTSGSKTGSPPDIAKLEKIREHIGDSRFALASGISLENVIHFKPTVDDFIVASSIIEKRDGKEYFIPEKVKQLGLIIHKP